MAAKQQVSLDLITDAYRKLQESATGPSKDGAFWLVGKGRRQQRIFRYHAVVPCHSRPLIMNHALSKRLALQCCTVAVKGGRSSCHRVETKECF